MATRPGEGFTSGSGAMGRRCVLGAAVLWSLSGVITKGLPLAALSIAFYRSLFAGLFLLPLVRPSRWRFRLVMVPIAMVFGGMIGLFIAAIQLTTAANAIFLQFSAVFWLVPLSALVLGEWPAPASGWGSASRPSASW